MMTDSSWRYASSMICFTTSCSCCCSARGFLTASSSSCCHVRAFFIASSSWYLFITPCLSDAGSSWCNSSGLVTHSYCCFTGKWPATRPSFERPNFPSRKIHKSYIIWENSRSCRCICRNIQLHWWTKVKSKEVFTQKSWPTHQVTHFHFDLLELGNTHAFRDMSYLNSWSSTCRPLVTASSWWW